LFCHVVRTARASLPQLDIEMVAVQAIVEHWGREVPA